MADGAEPETETVETVVVDPPNEAEKLVAAESPVAAAQAEADSRDDFAGVRENREAGRMNIYLEWKDLCFEVTDKEAPKDPETGKPPLKKILKGLCGRALPGQLVAVIGPSGSGKSSFLNCIGGRTQVGVTGKILYNGVDRPFATMARFSGYVVQDDVYFESLTVKETLTFAARLKLTDEQQAEKSIDDRVDELLTELDLQKPKDTRVGVIGKGISGGERRRLAIALEIISEPRFLLLDEPTSGLDSASALMVGRILLRLAHKKGITVLCTIHQPRPALATMFDRLYFLANGEEMYFGRSIPHCLPFFDSLGFRCPPMTNPADFLLDLVNTSDGASEALDKDKLASKSTTGLNPESADLISELADGVFVGDRMAIIAKIAEGFKNSEYRTQATQPIDIPDNEHGDTIFTQVLKDTGGSFYITPYYNQVYVVCTRSFLHKIREPIAFVTQVFNATVMPLLFGSIYWQIDKSQEAALDRVSAISLTILMMAFMAFDVLILFPSERQIFNREQASGMYRPSAFYIGRTLSEFPQHTLLSFLMATISYWMFGLQSDGGKYIIFCIILVSECWAGAGLLYLFGAVSANMEQSNLLATVFVLIFMLFDGSWISLDAIPVYWKWVRYISFIAYAGNAAIYTEYRGLEFNCKDEDSDDCFFHTGEDVLKQRGINNTDVWLNILLINVLNIIYRFMAFLGVWLMYRPLPAKLIIERTFNIELPSLPW